MEFTFTKEDTDFARAIKQANGNVCAAARILRKSEQGLHTSLSIGRKLHEQKPEGWMDRKPARQYEVYTRVMGFLNL